MLNSRSITITLTALIFMTSATVAEGAGTNYGTRDARTCASTKAPSKGAPSPAQARNYLTCHLEKESNGYIYLIEDVTVQVGKGTPYQQLPFTVRPFDGDPDGLVYEIRGSYKAYQCSELNDAVFHNIGTNCTVRDNPKAEGACFRNNFEEWTCNMQDLSFPTAIIHQAPPTN